MDMKIIMEASPHAGLPAARSARATALLRVGALSLATFIFVVDALTSVQIAIAVLYVIVILMSISLYSRSGVIAVAFSCGGLTLIAFFSSHGTDFQSQAFARCLVSLTAIGIATIMALKNKAANDELQEQVRVLAQTHDAIIVRDMDGKVTTWSPGAEALYGWSKAEAIGQDFRSLLNPQFSSSEKDFMESLLQMGTWEGEVVEHRRDGTQVTVVSRCSLSRDNHNIPKAILATHNDVSERRRAVDALRRSEAFLSYAQRLSQTGSFGIQLPSEDVYCSDEARRIFEFSEDEQPSLASVLKKVHPDDIGKVNILIKEANRRAPTLKAEVRLQMKDGRVKYVRMLGQGQAVSTDNYEYIGAVVDVTGSKLAEEALHRSQAELAHVTRITTLGELAASIAHEVNQPLAALITNGDAGLRWLKRETPNITEAVASIERMMSEARRASEVIRRIRALARNTAPQTMLLDLKEIVDESLALVDRELTRNKVIVLSEIDSRATWITGDRVQLQQVIINLIVNGIQAMANTNNTNRRLLLRLRRTDTDEVLVNVQDNGPGILPENMPKLFNAFFTTKPEGMGMGLSICRSIIEAHGGRIWATCNPGEGATLHFSLPTVNED